MKPAKAGFIVLRGSNEYSNRSSSRSWRSYRATVLEFLETDHSGANMKRCLQVALVLLCLSGFSQHEAEAFSKMFVFGDSLSDSGNIYGLTGGLSPPSPPYNERLTNGRVAVEYLADHLGVTLDPAYRTTTGTNYAIAGAMTGTFTVTYPLPPIPGGQAYTTENFADPVYGLTMLRTGTSLSSQVDKFVADAPAFNAHDTLFVVWGGANDYFLSPFASTVPASLANLGNIIATLVNSGARQFLIPNLPDLGQTPGVRAIDAVAPGTSAGLRALSMAFNAGLDGVIDDFESGLAGVPGVAFHRFDTFTAFDDLLTHPGDYGLANTTTGCVDILAPAVVCNDAATRLFWDDTHPTDVVHGILGAQFAQAVPEPSVWASFVLGLGICGWRLFGRRQGHAQSVSA